MSRMDASPSTSSPPPAPDESRRSITTKMTAPMMGPGSVPMPPATTMKTRYADQEMAKPDGGVMMTASM